MNTVSTSLEWAKRLFNTINAGVVIIDPDKKEIIDINNQALIMLGCNRDELVGSLCTDKFCGMGDTCPIIDAGLYLEEYETILQRTDGSKILILKTVNTIFCDNRRYLVESFIDVTKLKDSEERVHSLLKLSESKFSSEKELSMFALDEAVKLTDSKVGYLHFVNDDNSEDSSIDLFVWSTGTLEKCSMHNNESHYELHKAGIWADCIRSRKPVVHNNYINESNKKGYPEGHFPVTRHMSVPVINGGDLIVAVMGVGNKETPYTEFDIEQLQLFANSMWYIVKRKRLELELADSEKRYRDLVERAPATICEIDFNDLKIITADGDVEKLSGYTKHELIGMSPLDLLSNSDIDRFKNYVHNVVTSEHKLNSNEFEGDLLTKSGSFRNVLLQINYRVRESDDHVIAYVIVSDITDLRNAEFKAETYLNLSPSIFVALNMAGEITMLNKFGRDLLNCDDGVIGKSWFDTFVLDSEVDDVKKVFEDLVNGNKEFSTYENNIITINGDVRIISWRNTTLKDADGNIEAVLSAGDDITEQRLAENKLEAYWINEGARLERTLNEISLLSNNGVDTDS